MQNTIRLMFTRLNQFMMKILDEIGYQNAFQKIDMLIASDFESSEHMQKEFLELATAIQEYEKKHYPLHAGDLEKLTHNKVLNHHQQ